MESFFLAETTKYLYLLFDTENFIHNTGGHGKVINTTNGECVIETGGYVFNTEAHPLDSAAVHCCSPEKKAQDDTIQHFHDNVDLLALLGIVEPKMDVFSSPKKKRKPKSIKPDVQQQNQVTIRLDKNVKVETPEVKDTENKEAGRIRLPLPAPGEEGKNEFENRVKKLLQDVRLSPATKDDVVDRILSTLQDAVKTAQQATGIDADPNTADVQPSEPVVQTETEENTQPNQDVNQDSQPNQDVNQHSQINLDVNQDSQPKQYNNQDLQSNQDINQDLPKLQQEEGDTTEKYRQNADNQKTNINSEIQSDTKLDDVDMCSAQDKKAEESIDESEEESDDEDDVEARLLTCPAQPFYMRLSVMGEMFMPRL